MTIAAYINPGVLDIRALTVLGIHAKPNSDNPIGQFGTGLKYAIAVLMRHAASITIQTGDEEVYTVEKSASDFRGEAVEDLWLVNTNDNSRTRLPFTTRLGMNWELWMVMRELECNARDEAGSFSFVDRVGLPQPNQVAIYVDCPAFVGAINKEREKTFFDVWSKNRDVVETDGFQYVKEPNQFIYYRGIRVGMSNYPMLNTYNFKSGITLTEDRMITYFFSINGPIAEHMSTLSDEDEIERLLASEGSYEWRHVFEYYSSAFSENTVFMKVATRLHGMGVKLPQVVHNMIIDKLLQDELRKRADLSNRETRVLEDAIRYCKQSGYPVDDYEIRVVSRIRNNVYGMADTKNNVILIGKLAFEFGIETVMATLIEEWLHIQYGFHDESRSMQDWLLRQLTIQCIEKVENDD